ncbi:MAG: hypothetical protein AAGA93_05110 [Actinomycetota bacterium]
MSLRMLARAVEGFFRRWPIYLALVAAALALGLANATSVDRSYTSSGTMFVDNQSLVTAQSGVQDGNFFSYYSPAQFTSQELAGLLQTEVFIDSVIERAGVELAQDPMVQADQIIELRDALTAGTSSENLVRVSASTPDPDLSFRLASATIDEFVQFKINVDIAESSASEDFFDDLTEVYREQLVDAREEVDAALLGVVDIEDLPPRRQVEIERLQEAELLAEARYRAALDDVEASKLAKLQTDTDVRQGYSIFDPPFIPTNPDSSVRDQITTFALYAVVGVGLALAIPTLLALGSRTVLFTGDLPNEPPTLAVVPKVSRRLVKVDVRRSTAAAAPVAPQPVAADPAPDPDRSPAVAESTTADAASDDPLADLADVLPDFSSTGASPTDATPATSASGSKARDTTSKTTGATSKTTGTTSKTTGATSKTTGTTSKTTGTTSKTTDATPKTTGTTAKTTGTTPKTTGTTSETTGTTSKTTGTTPKTTGTTSKTTDATPKTTGTTSKTTRADGEASAKARAAAPAPASSRPPRPRPDPDTRPNTGRRRRAPAAPAEGGTRKAAPKPPGANGSTERTASTESHSDGWMVKVRSDTKPADKTDEAGESEEIAASSIGSKTQEIPSKPNGRPGDA